MGYLDALGANTFVTGPRSDLVFAPWGRRASRHGHGISHDYRGWYSGRTHDRGECVDSCQRYSVNRGMVCRRVLRCRDHSLCQALVGTSSSRS